MAIAIDFIWQITFFVSILAIDQRRMMRGYRDFCCCLKAKVVGEDDLRLDQSLSQLRTKS